MMLQRLADDDPEQQAAQRRSTGTRLCQLLRHAEANLPEPLRADAGTWQEIGSSVESLLLVDTSLLRRWQQRASSHCAVASRHLRNDNNAAYKEWVAKSLLDGARVAHRHVNIAGRLPPPVQEVLIGGVWALTPMAVMEWRVAKSEPIWKK